MKDSNHTIPLSRPDISPLEIDSVLEVLKTPYLSLGPKLPEFEQKFAEYVGSEYAVAVSSGTAGLHLAIKSLGIGLNDAVITTPFSFVASANCILFEGATPIFIDIEENTLNLDINKVKEYLEKSCYSSSGKLFDQKTGKCVKAILPVHVFGQPCEMVEIMELAHEFNLYVIEDACEAIGAEVDGKKVGTFGNLGVFAFYPNKQMTTGEGGMIVTDDENLTNLLRSLRNQGRGHHGGWLAHDQLGYNYRLSDLNCALGIAQLSRIEEILEKRKKVASLYNAKLNGIVKAPGTNSGFRKSWFVYVVCLSAEYTQKARDAILDGLSKNNIGCNNYFPPIHLQPYYKKKFGYKEGDFPITERISERTIALPFYNNLTEEDISLVVDSFKGLLKSLNADSRQL